MPIVGNKDYSPNSDALGAENMDKHSNKSHVFVGREPYWNIDEIILDDETKGLLKDVIIYLQNKQRIVMQWGLDKFLKGSHGCTGINMYGKPGTGKTIAADAIAKALGKRIIKVDYSEIQNEKWGGTERQLTALFKSAIESDSIIFFDESDSLLGRRQANGANSETNNQIKAHLLTLLDEYNVIVFFATNLFENYDRAFFRRILFHIKFPLPDKKELKQMWLFHLGDISDEKKVPRNIVFSVDKLVEDSIGLSGGDIKNITLKVCIHLVSRNIKELTNDIMLNEIVKYRNSLKDMEVKSSTQQVRKLQGVEAERAKEIFDNKDSL